jgi:hypothetical protein
MTVAQVTSLWDYYTKAMRAASEPQATPGQAASVSDLSQWLGVPVERGA